MGNSHAAAIHSAVLLFALLTIVSGVEAIGLIRTIYIGDCLMRPGFPTPGLAEDPKISMTRVVGELAFITEKELNKAMRIYLPRTDKHLTENYDLVIISALKSTFLTHAFNRWVAEGVLAGDLAFLMADDPVSFGCVDAWDGSGVPGWMESPVGLILPVDDDNRINHEDINFRFTPAAEFADDPFNQGIPWEQVTVYSHNKPTEKIGSKVLLRTTDETFASLMVPKVRNAPVFVYWDIEDGRTAAVCFDWGGRFGTEFYRWEYWKDVVARFIYVPARAEIPTDVELTHTIRQTISRYNTQRGITISMLEFADKMGANTADVEYELGLVSDKRREADQLWIQGEFNDCYATILEAVEGLELVSEMAVRSKDSALLWIYISEWAVVTGTLCATGGVIWTLMIRRAMYREVSTTSARQKQ